uniref:Chromosome 11 open reading frame 54 n=1 Tax=Salmo trutta TaxID=8032 RepID=A0A673YXF9_SALTR
MADVSKTEQLLLHVPKLKELCDVLQRGLKNNFADRPHLSFPSRVTGLCGKSRITDVGGVPNLVPLVKMDKEYNMNTCLLEKNSDTFSDCDFRLLANLYACEGKPGMVNDGGLKKISELGCLEFSACPLNSNDDVNNWPKHFEVSGLDLRVEHTHCFSHNGEGGLPCDTTSDTVEYLGCFMPAEFVYRIDRPKDTHDVERD